MIGRRGGAMGEESVKKENPKCTRGKLNKQAQRCDIRGNCGWHSAILSDESRSQKNFETKPNQQEPEDDKLQPCRVDQWLWEQRFAFMAAPQRFEHQGVCETGQSGSQDLSNK